MGILDLLGFGTKGNEVKEFVAKGAVIVDVRTVEEFKSGHIQGAENIPLNLISTKIESIKKSSKPVITCCASGMRSAQAASILKNNNIEAINGGGWQSLKSKL